MDKPQIAEPGPDDGALTIDELARRVGMSVRNLREWRALGLLPAPTMRGRVGFYDPSEVARIETIKDLHAEGFTLELIRRILDAAGDHAEEAMRFAAALRAPFRSTDPPAADPDALGSRWGLRDPSEVERAAAIGLVRTDPDGTLVFTSDTIVEVGQALHRLGLSATEVLDAAERIRAHADAIAELFEELWRRHVWEPFVAADLPDAELERVQAAVAGVQPLAVDAVSALFTVAMEARIEDGIRREIQRVLPGS